MNVRGKRSCGACIGILITAAVRSRSVSGGPCISRSSAKETLATPSRARVSLARVKVGEIELTNVQGVVLNGAYPLDVLLGMSWLSRVRMDERDNLLLLERKF